MGDKPNVAQTPPALYRAMDTANLLVEQGRATRALVQDGRVYVEGAACAGCGGDGRGLPLLVDEPNQGNPWCPACGGRSLVALERGDEVEFENGLCRMQGSRVIHLIAPPYGEHPLCMPGAIVGRMQGASAESEPTCQRCIRARDGEATYTTAEQRRQAAS